MSRDLTDPDLRAVGGSRVRNVALLVAGCFFMELLDGTIVVTAIPRISSSLGITAGAAGLVVTAYLVTVAVLIPLSAWLTLRYGYRRVLLRRSRSSRSLRWAARQARASANWSRCGCCRPSAAR